MNRAPTWASVSTEKKQPCAIFSCNVSRDILPFSAMGAVSNTKNGPPKMMLGFIVRRCAADLGHMPSPDEFAAWANEQKQNGRRYCLFGKPISPIAAQIMFKQPGRLVTVRPEGLASLGKND